MSILLKQKVLIKTAILVKTKGFLSNEIQTISLFRNEQLLHFSSVNTMTTFDCVKYLSFRRTL